METWLSGPSVVSLLITVKYVKRVLRFSTIDTFICSVSKLKKMSIFFNLALHFLASVRWTCLCRPRWQASLPRELKTLAVSSLLAHTKWRTVMMESDGTYIKMKSSGRTRYGALTAHNNRVYYKHKADMLKKKKYHRFTNAPVLELCALPFWIIYHNQQVRRTPDRKGNSSYKRTSCAGDLQSRKCLDDLWIET